MNTRKAPFTKASHVIQLLRKTVKALPLLERTQATAAVFRPPVGAKGGTVASPRVRQCHQRTEAILTATVQDLVSGFHREANPNTMDRTARTKDGVAKSVL
jgi:hypothetical protein